MSYNPSLLEMVAGKPYSAYRAWIYKSEDAMTSVRGADYFDDAQIRGMQVGDLVIVVQVNSSNVVQAAYVATVLTVDGDGADLGDGTAITVTNS